MRTEHGWRHSQRDRQRLRGGHNTRSRLTAGDLKSIVQEDAVPRRIAGVEDLPVLHDDLGVERDPPASGLLSGG